MPAALVVMAFVNAFAGARQQAYWPFGMASIGLDQLLGETYIRTSLADLAAGRMTVPALVVSIGAGRLGGARYCSPTIDRRSRS